MIKLYYRYSLSIVEAIDLKYHSHRLSGSMPDHRDTCQNKKLSPVFSFVFILSHGIVSPVGCNVCDLFEIVVVISTGNRR